MMRAGMARGITLPRPAMAKVVPQLREIVTANLTDNIFWAPIKAMPTEIPARDRQRISDAYAAALTKEVLPAYTRLADFIERDYLPAARTTVAGPTCPTARPGIAGASAGATTMDMTGRRNPQPRAGGSRAHPRRDARGERAGGLHGRSRCVLQDLEEDPRFYFRERRRAARTPIADVKRRIDALLPKLFADFPKADYEIRPVEAFRAASAAGASYQSPSPDGKRPGIFYINTHNLKAQPRFGLETLSLHEASPGPPFPDFHPAGAHRSAAHSAASTATCRIRKAGRCTRSPSARSSECSPIRTSGTAGCPTKCCAPCAWWWTPGFTRRAGRASRPSGTCSTTPRWPRAT